jgi:hypothetical protein
MQDSEQTKPRGEQEMRLLLILPRVEPEEIKPPSECRYEDCDGTRFQFLQEVEKPLRDTKHTKVMAHRYQCLRFFRTHRVYSNGISKNHMSQRAKIDKRAGHLVVPVGVEL